MEKEKSKIIRQQIVKVNGEVAHKEFQKVKLLGKGGFANCYLTKNLETGVQTATKVVSKEALANPRTKIKLENQIKIHKMMHCEYIVKFHHAFEDSDNVYVMMELCSNKDLNDYLNDKRRFSVPQAQKFLRELCLGIKYLHDKKVIHRDIKLGNIFLGEEKKVKIGDFGLATKLEFQNEKKRTICGTPNYLAPEIIKGVGYSYQVDIWSIGIILYTFLVGTPPFETNDLQQTLQKIMQNKYHYYGIDVPFQAKQLIRRILNINPSNRPTVDEIIGSDFMKYGKASILKQLGAFSASSNKQNSNQFSCLIQSVADVKDGICYLMNNKNKCLVLEKQSIILPENKDYIYVIQKDKVDKVRKTLVSEMSESITKQRFMIQSVKFQQSKSSILQNTISDCQEQPLVYVRKYLKNKNSWIFRMSNQTVHLKWVDGFYAISNKNKTIWITNGKKQQITLSINQEKPMSKQMSSKFQTIKQILIRN